MVALRELDRRIELLGGHVQGAAKEADPAEHGESVGLPPGLPGSLGELDGLPQEAGGPAVVGAIAFRRAEVGHGLRLQRGRAACELEGIGEPEFGPVVVAAEEVHVPEFGPRLRYRVKKVIGQRYLVGFVQGGQALFVQAPERVDQRLGEREP